ncbi:MAG: T9SS type A sorting domain-containing protein [Bacteroidota bacterium]
MKKIIFTICLIGMMQNVFAKEYPYSHYYNITQGDTGGGVWEQNVNVIANYGDSVLFQAYIHFHNTTLYYYPVRWKFNGVIIPNAAGQEFLTVVINQSGTYCAKFSDESYNIYFHVTNITGIQAVNNVNFLNVYPTAVTSSITIQLNSIKTNDVEISFFDMNGKQLKNDFYKNIVGEFIKNENTEALSKGIYFLRIKTGEDVVEKKFVKM